MSNCTGCLDRRQLGDRADIGEEDVGWRLRSELPCGRRVDVPQQPVPDSVVGDGIERAVDAVQHLHRTCVLAVCAGEGNRVDRGEPADGSMQIDIGFEDQPAVPGEVDGDHTVTDRPCDRTAQRRKEYLVGGQSKTALRLVDLGCQLACQRRRQSRQIVGVGWFGNVLVGDPQGCPAGVAPARSRDFPEPRDGWRARRIAATTRAMSW